MMNKSVLIALGLLFLIVLGYWIFRTVFFDETETISPNDWANFELKVNESTIHETCLNLGLSVTFSDGQYLISNGREEFYWKYSPVVTFVDTTYLIFTTGNWGITDNLLEVIFFPDYSQIVTLRFKDLKMIKSVRIPGVVKNAVVIDGYVYFSQEWDQVLGRFKLN